MKEQVGSGSPHSHSEVYPAALSKENTASGDLCPHKADDHVDLPGQLKSPARSAGVGIGQGNLKGLLERDVFQIVVLVSPEVAGQERLGLFTLVLRPGHRSAQALESVGAPPQVRASGGA